MIQLQVPPRKKFEIKRVDKLNVQREAARAERERRQHLFDLEHEFERHLIMITPDVRTVRWVNVMIEGTEAMNEYHADELRFEFEMMRRQREADYPISEGDFLAALKPTFEGWLKANGKRGGSGERRERLRQQYQAELDARYAAADYPTPWMDWGSAEEEDGDSLAEAR